jgi:hypothetical protein
VTNKTVEAEILFQMQQILFELECQNQNDLKSLRVKNNCTMQLPEKTFAMKFTESDSMDHLYFVRTLSQYIDVLKHPKMHFTMKHEALPDHFASVPISNLLKSYNSNFSKILNIKKEWYDSKPSISTDCPNETVDEESSTDNKSTHQTPPASPCQAFSPQSSQHSMVITQDNSKITTMNTNTLNFPATFGVVLANPGMVYNNVPVITQPICVAAPFIPEYNGYVGGRPILPVLHPGTISQIQLRNEQKMQLHFLRLTLNRTIQDCTSPQLPKDKLLTSISAMMQMLQNLRNSVAAV